MPSDLQELIQSTSIKLGIAPYLVEKDFYLSKVIQAVYQYESDQLHCILHGGTSLSKCYRITQRMSEDCDFRVLLINGEVLSPY